MVVVFITDLEKRLYNEMINNYKRADQECGYRAPRFLQMLDRRGPVEAAKILIRKPAGGEGFIKLLELGRLDLSIEALVIRDEFKPLFTEEEIEICRKKLEECDYLKSRIKK
ncbi:MAG: hypothetical protein WAQ88_08230 [Caldicoprobacterales bacterium]|jgi:hypothetical protein